MITSRRLAHDHLGTRGAVAVEAALLMPILTLLILGGLDVARFARITGSADRVAVSVADLITQCDRTSFSHPSTNLNNPCDIGAIYQAAVVSAGGIDLTNDGEIIVSSVGWYSISPTTPGDLSAMQRVLWQDVSPYTETGVASSVGTPGMIAKLPGGNILPEAHNVIVVEVFVRFHPWITLDLWGWLNFLDTHIYRTAVFRPRSPRDLRL